MVLKWIQKWVRKQPEEKEEEIEIVQTNPSTYQPIEPVEAELEARTKHAEKISILARHPRKGHGEEDAHKMLEAALFMSTKGMNVEELSKVTNLPILETRSLIPTFVEKFNARDTALEIVEDSGGFRMKVRAPYDEHVSYLAGGSELTAGEMKTLAFIAYKQPLLQSKLVQVRSNTAYDHLQVLVEKGFVSRETKGRSYILRTTKKFEEYFGTHALKLKPMKAEELGEKVDHTQAEELS